MSAIKEYLEQCIKLYTSKQLIYNSKILELGKEYDVSKINEAESIVFGKFVGARIKECFRNSILLAHNNPNLAYVEGFVYYKKFPFPIEHAWNVDKTNGNIIESTLCLLDDGLKIDEYFGIEIPMENIVEYLDNPQHMTAMQHYIINMVF